MGRLGVPGRADGDPGCTDARPQRQRSGVHLGGGEEVVRGERHGVSIDPASPWQNGIVESFNGRLQDEFPSSENFDTRAEARYLVERRLLHCDHRCTQRAFGRLTTAAFAASCPAEPRHRRSKERSSPCTDSHDGRTDENDPAGLGRLGAMIADLHQLSYRRPRGNTTSDDRPSLRSTSHRDVHRGRRLVAACTNVFRSLRIVPNRVARRIHVRLGNDVRRAAEASARSPGQGGLAPRIRTRRFDSSATSALTITGRETFVRISHLRLVQVPQDVELAE
jgi:hypothetical protein